MNAFERDRDDLLSRYGDGFAWYQLGEFKKHISPQDAEQRGLDDRVYAVFRIETREVQLARAQESQLATDTLICEPFLDTDVPESLYEADTVLIARGWTPRKIALTRRIAATGLWWNGLWWEWVSLGRADFLFGWHLNLMLAAGVAFVFWPSDHPAPRLAATLGLALASFALRQAATRISRRDCAARKPAREDT